MFQVMNVQGMDPQFFGHNDGADSELDSWCITSIQSSWGWVLLALLGKAELKPGPERARGVLLYGEAAASKVDEWIPFWGQTRAANFFYGLPKVAWCHSVVVSPAPVLSPRDLSVVVLPGGTDGVWGWRCSAHTHIAGITHAVVRVDGRGWTRVRFAVAAT